MGLQPLVELAETPLAYFLRESQLPVRTVQEFTALSPDEQVDYFTRVRRVVSVKKEKFTEDVDVALCLLAGLVDELGTEYNNSVKRYEDITGVYRRFVQMRMDSSNAKKGVDDLLRWYGN